jgi:microcystin-dependent protein
MATPFMGQISIFAFNFAPKGWAMCNGQLLPINQNQALFSILGTTYGGNGQTNFALPNMQGRTPIYQGQGFILGQPGGQENHTLIMSEMPQHTHNVSAGPAAALVSGNGNLPGAGTTTPFYAGSGNTTMNPAVINNVGGSQPHPNLSPFLVLNICIALQGIFPSRN